MPRSIEHERALTSAVAQATGEAGAQFVDPNQGPGSFLGHDACAGRQSWFTRVNAQHVSYSDHPNKKGQEALAGDVARAIAAGSSGGATAIDASALHTCDLLAAGSVDCWGDNVKGELGDGSTTGPDLCALGIELPLRFGPGAPLTGFACSTTAKPATGVTAATAIGTGTGPTCVVVSGGGVECLETTPMVVSGITTATSVSASDDGHACAVLTGGSVECWGANSEGQLGDGTSGAPSATPVTVQGITNAVAVRAGALDTCALLSGGSVECWGGNQDGDLGDGETAGSAVPVRVSGITNAIAIGAGAFDTCAVLAGGTVECWGNNNAGQLGDGTSTGPEGVGTCQDEACSPTPVPVTAITNATAVTIGGETTSSPLFPESTHACALLSGGSVECWGANELGQLGDGTFVGPEVCAQSCSSTPVPVSGITNASAVSAGEDHTCALLSGGGVRCWGSNFFGQLGDGSFLGPETCPPFAPEEEISCSTRPEPVSGIP